MATRMDMKVIKMRKLASELATLEADITALNIKACDEGDKRNERYVQGQLNSIEITINTLNNQLKELEIVQYGEDGLRPYSDCTGRW